MHHSSFLMTLILMLQLKVNQLALYPCSGELDLVLGAIACKFRGSGQTCVCANRIYVQSSVYAEFASRLAEKVSAFKIGDGTKEDTYVYSKLYTACLFTWHLLLERTGL